MYEALVAMDAPPALIAWASSAQNDDQDSVELLARNQDPAWTIWISTGAGVPLRGVIEVVLLEAEQAVERLTEAQATLRELLDVTRQTLARGGDTAAVLSAAERAEAIAEHPPGSYRSLVTQPIIAPIATACAYVARAVEALASAEWGLSTQRLTMAQGQAALLGMGASALLPPSATRALCLNPAALERDPVQRQALFIPAAAAEAVSQLLLARARELGAPDQGAAEAMNARITDLLAPLILA